MSDYRTRIKRSAADAINRLADQVAALSLPETPLLWGPLRASAVYPGNDGDGSHTATADDLEAMVSYNTVYAAAQHEGYMEYNRNGKHIIWIVKRHTEPGTKTKYLEDPFKAMVPRMEPFISASIRAELDKP